MIIREIAISRYGPLAGRTLKGLGGFSLVCGHNEDGKSLTIDALVKLMLGSGKTAVKAFERIDRVEEQPEGYVILETDDGRTCKLPEQGQLTTLTDLNASLCRNLFVVRSSDLAVASPGFYKEVTDRLTGLQSGVIAKISARLAALGRVTATGRLSDDSNMDKIGSRVKRAGELAGQAAALIRRIEAEGLDRIEFEAQRIRGRREQAAAELEKLEAARQRGLFDQASRALAEAAAARDEAQALAGFDEKTERTWRDCERDIRTLTAAKEKLAAEIETRQAALDKARSRVQETEKEYTTWEERKRTVDEELRPQVRSAEKEAEKEAGLKSRARTYGLAGIGLAVILVIGMIVMAIKPHWVMYVLNTVFGGLTVAVGALWFLTVRAGANLAVLFQHIRLKLARFEIKGDSLESMETGLQHFDEAVAVRRREREEARTACGVLEGEIADRLRRLSETDRRIEEAREHRDEIAAAAGLSSLNTYSEQLVRANEAVRRFDQAAARLDSLLRTPAVKDRTERFRAWQAGVDRLTRYSASGGDMDFSEARRDALKQEARELEAAREQAALTLKDVRRQFGDAERAANEVLRAEPYVVCETLEELRALHKRLEQFSAGHRAAAADALAAINIFEQIAGEEHTKVAALFGPDSAVSSLFRTITDGRYTAVSMDAGTSAIMVTEAAGTVRPAAVLSAGAYDQLYLAIRVALGRKLLGDRQGFFILDDPFIRSDADRLGRQLEALKRIVAEGWQIIYFTAKDEVRDALGEDIRQGAVSVHVLDGREG